MAIQLDAGRVPAWFADAVRQLRAAPGVRVIGFVGGAPSVRGSGELDLLSRGYAALDRILFPLPRDPWAPVDARAAFPDLEIVEQPSDVSVFLSATPPEPERARSFVASRDARWLYARIGDGTAAPGTAEVLSRAPSLGVTIELLDRHGARVLATGSFALHPASARRSAHHAYWKLGALLAREVVNPTDGSTEATRDVASPHVGAWSVLATAGAYLRGRRLETTHDWALGVGRAPTNAGWRDAALAALSPLHPPPGHFWADPFPIAVAGKEYVFFEDYDASRRKGHISVLALCDAHVAEPPRAVLDTPAHLSYPFLLEHGGKLFMIPECSASGAVPIYECATFPERWTQAGELLSGVSAVDATLHEDERGWWLFTSIAPEDTPNTDQLSIFHARSPLGPWRPHRRNPVKTDVVGTRPAGKLFVEGGALLRPAQDCSFRYGRAIVINQIDRLTETEFAERPIGRIDATWLPGLRGCHTFNRAGDLVVMDGLARRSRRRA